MKTNGTINMPIGRSTRDRKKMAVTKNGKEAITEFKVIKKYSDFTLIELKIKTGRTHQIRVHMAEIGFPTVRRCYILKRKKSVWHKRPNAPQ